MRIRRYLIFSVFVLLTILNSKLGSSSENDKTDFNGIAYPEIALRFTPNTNIKSNNFKMLDIVDSWLPTDEKTNSEMPEVDLLLKSLSGKIRLLGCKYQGNILKTSKSFTNGELSINGAKWLCDASISSVEDDKGAIDLNLTFKLLKGNVNSAGVAIAFDFYNWSANNYVLAPAAVYNGNRFKVLPVKYPPYIYDEKDRPLDMPVTITNFQHLNTENKAARIELNTGNCATPMLSFYDPKAKRGWIALTTQETRFGNTGMIIEENAAHDKATFVFSAPGVREFRTAMCTKVPSGDKGADWNAGDEVSLKIRLYSFKAADIPEFYDEVFDVRKALSGKNTYRNITPYSAIAKMICKHHDETKWYEDDKYSYITNNPNSHYGCQIGWGGIPVYGFPQLILETPERLRRVFASFNTITDYVPGKTGLLHAMFYKGQLVGDNFKRSKEKPSIAMIRRSGETLYFMLQQLELLKLRGHQNLIQPEWENMLQGIADGLTNVWTDYGQFGQFIDVETGKMEINGSSNGAVCIGSLALASKYFYEPKYLKVAEAAGEFYYRRDLSQGYVGGGPAEILQAPDMESAFNLMESYVVLYETTGKEKWLNYACDAAHLLSTWMTSYDYRFPPNSHLGQAKINATGSINASVQNNHSSPGLYISSGDFLLKLYRATGDKRYAEMYKDLAHNVVQYVQTKTNPLLGTSPYGAVSERVNLSDWEGKAGIGRVNQGDSNMAWETVAALTCLQNPGIYLRTDDTYDILVLDHVEVQVIKKDKSGVSLKITNPTVYDASVSILAESGKQSKMPLGWNAFTKWPHIELKAGETGIFRIDKDGKIIKE